MSDLANGQDRDLKKSETWAGDDQLGDWSISLRLRAWVPAREFVQVRSDITKSVKQAFDAAGIEIPYPHQVELVREGISLKTGEPESAD